LKKRMIIQSKQSRGKKKEGKKPSALSRLGTTKTLKKIHRKKSQMQTNRVQGTSLRLRVTIFYNPVKKCTSERGCSKRGRKDPKEKKAESRNRAGRKREGPTENLEKCFGKAQGGHDRRKKKAASRDGRGGREGRLTSTITRTTSSASRAPRRRMLIIGPFR